MIKYIAGSGAGLLAVGLYLLWEGFSFISRTVLAAGCLFMVWVLIEA